MTINHTNPSDHAAASWLSQMGAPGGEIYAGRNKKPRPRRGNRRAGPTQSGARTGDARLVENLPLR